MGCSIPVRIWTAEQWRLAGERLRRRDPRRFAQMLDLISELAIAGPDPDDSEIDEVYLEH